MFYTEFDSDTIRIQLSTLGESYHSFRKVKGVIHSIMSLIFLKRTKRYGPSYQTLVKIILVMPAINASSERAFSALRRVKSYPCTTMSNNRLDHLMICTVYKELVKELNFKQVTMTLWIE